MEPFTQYNNQILFEEEELRHIIYLHFLCICYEQSAFLLLILCIKYKYL